MQRKEGPNCGVYFRAIPTFAQGLLGHEGQGRRIHAQPG